MNQGEKDAVEAWLKSWEGAIITSRVIKDFANKFKAGNIYIPTVAKVCFGDYVHKNFVNKYKDCAGCKVRKECLKKSGGDNQW